MALKDLETEITPIDVDADLLFGEWNPAKQVANSMVSLPKLVTIEKRSFHVFDVDNFYCLLFAVKGTAKAYVMCDEIEAILPNQMLLVPMGKLLKVETGDMPISLLCLEFRPSINLCMGNCPRTGNDASNKKYKGPRNKELDVITRLEMNDGVKLWLQQMLYYIKLTPKAMPAYEIKLRELFFILRLSMANKEYHKFLESYHCHNLGFRAFVFRHHLDCKTVEDMAELMQLSTSTVKRLFLDEFGLSPLKWMHEQKARYIYRDLSEDKLTLQEIADRYHFSSISYLCVFCRKAFGATPLKVRRTLVPEEE